MRVKTFRGKKVIGKEQERKKEMKIERERKKGRKDRRADEKKGKEIHNILKKIEEKRCSEGMHFLDFGERTKYQYSRLSFSLTIIR